MIAALSTELIWRNTRRPEGTSQLNLHDRTIDLGATPQVRAAQHQIS